MNNKDFYKVFEDNFRGSRESIKTRLQVYSPFIEKIKTLDQAAQCLDLGCGRGEWLELLGEMGVKAHGVDSSDGMLQDCHSLNLSYTQEDILTYLKRLPSESQSVISGFHIAEHLPFDSLKILIEESLRVLKPAGLLILETPNPENVLVGTMNFYIDPTHQRVLPPALLMFLFNYYGYQKTKIMRLQERIDFSTAEEVRLTDVFGGVSPDYAVVGQKNGPAESLALLEPEFAKEYGINIEQLITQYELKLAQKLDRRFGQLEQEIKNIYASKTWQIGLFIRNHALAFRNFFHKIKSILKLC
jgi:SAM-dependent methyltransferase